MIYLFAIVLVVLILLHISISIWSLLLIALGIGYLAVAALLFFSWGMSGDGIFYEPDVAFNERYGIYRGSIVWAAWWLINVPLWPVGLLCKVLVGLILGR